MAESKGRILVIDDEAEIRESLQALLGLEGYEVDSAPDGAAGLAALEARAYDMVLLDLMLPDRSGLEVLEELRRYDAATPVAVITAYGSVESAVAAMKLGAADFLEKPFDDVAILDTVKSALARREKAYQHDALREQVSERIAALSQRERQVLECLVVGQANKTIAYELGISPRTVEVYRANVMTKMKAQSLSELVRMALLAGISPKAA